MGDARAAAASAQECSSVKSSGKLPLHSLGDKVVRSSRPLTESFWAGTPTGVGDGQPNEWKLWIRKHQQVIRRRLCRPAGGRSPRSGGRGSLWRQCSLRLCSPGRPGVSPVVEAGLVSGDKWTLLRRASNRAPRPLNPKGLPEGAISARLVRQQTPAPNPRNSARPIRPWR